MLHTNWNQGWISLPWPQLNKMTQKWQHYCTAITGLVLQNVQFGPSGNTLLCDTSTGHPRPIVPAYFRKTVFDVIHGLSVRARLTTLNWLDEPPWVLLGIRTAPKEGLHCSLAELVYSTPLTVPGDFVAVSQVQKDSAILPHLRELVRKFTPVPTTYHRHSKASLPKDLRSSEYVFIRCDAHRTPLQRPYEGPFHVLERGPKFFKINFGGGTDTVTVDCLKPI